MTLTFTIEEAHQIANGDVTPFRIKALEEASRLARNTTSQRLRPKYEKLVQDLSDDEPR